MMRKASISDLGVCLEMGRQFHEEAVLPEIPFDGADMSKSLTSLIDGDNSCLFVAEVGGKVVGMVGAVKYPHYTNSSCHVAQELFWWVRPEFRGGLTGVRLLMTVEQWAIETGCKSIVMICLPIDGPAESIYLRAGYRALERSYIKGL